MAIELGQQIFSLAWHAVSRVVDVQRFALFDLDGTLVDRQAAYTDAVTDLCSAHRYGADVERWLLTRLVDRAGPCDFVRLHETFRLDTPAARLWQEYVDLMASSVACEPAVLKGLAQLRAAEWTIGVATNGASDIQRAKLAATGIRDLVHGVAASGDLDIRKPDRRLFALAATRCGLDLANGGWMIGDNPVGDIEGAHHAGLSSIWLHGRPWPQELPAPRHVVDDAVGAIDLLLNETE